MQTLALQLTTTLVDDAIAFAKEIGRSIVALVTSPIERIAHACDVAGVLDQRRAQTRAPHRATRTGHGYNPRNRPFSLFGGLSELT